MLLPFQIALSAVGIERVVIGDDDVTSDVCAVSVVSDPNEITQVYLTARAGVELKGEGVVTAVTQQQFGPAIAQWLRQLDAAEIEQHVMRQSDMTESFTTALLSYLASMVEHA